MAGYLAAFQVHGVKTVWDPFFGSAGSAAVLRSSVSRALPFPDAAAGGLAYLIEAGGSLLGGDRRYLHRPCGVLAITGLMAAMALGSLGLVMIQAFWVRSWCTLCLASAALSWVILFLGAREGFAAWSAWRAGRRADG